MAINDYTDCVDQRAKHVNPAEHMRMRILQLIENEMKVPYGDFQIGAHMALIQLRAQVTELQL